LALTLLPSKLSDWLPPACKFCRKLFRKVCSAAVEAVVETPAPAAVAGAAGLLPFTSLTNCENELLRFEVAALVEPFVPTCWIRDCSEEIRLPAY